MKTKKFLKILPVHCYLITSTAVLMEAIKLQHWTLPYIILGVSMGVVMQLYNFCETEKVDD